ncbi:ATP-binding component of an ABC superfamily putrescine transporter [Yokenella regensburgei ATCC 49455]|uniref:Spermidine/putrescine import ATP-binding protein PotA n=1 Tax=Yokenella regensburgei TaxID=158877 RepID=A0AB38FQ74_9ENTR|nr:ATP-binding component of an ABC superfamily putrescine transporter [Yokenella regensburgei ATCC 49455]SQA59972.1 Spermidine/putrescine import ATP-binding protein PotA [Yokenella regensburgei]SQA67843.1 Spermidine/putrescine import ATP-binding protein PotA [Yokenella regensburgei]SUQ06155.1 Spermidine/putrescine import ATP-binding protein PotA [Yokenella regensburgei]
MNDATPRPQAKIRKALTPLLEIRNLTKSFDGQHAVDDVSLTIYKGEIFALLGASGCGKSTLLRMLAGFEPPTAGQIVLDGVDLSHVPPYQRPINMMFQSYALFPHMTVEQNIAFGLKQDKLPKAEIDSRVQEMLTLVHMQEFAKRKRISSPAASASVWPWPEALPSARNCCCLMSRWARWIKSCATGCSSKWPIFSSG